MNPYDFGYSKGMLIDHHIEGIYASRNRDKHGLLSRFVYEGGHGDHLEVGSLYGASAILAAMTKVQFELRGNVICVDPFIDEDIDPSIKALTDFEISLDRLKYNAHIMGVTNVTPYAMTFRQFKIKGLTFVSAYIDGDHTYEGIKHDWEKAAPHVSKIVFFDDYNDSRFPGVQKFIDELDHPEWKKEINGQYAIMRRI